MTPTKNNYNALDLYPSEAASGTQVMFVNFGKAETAAAMKMLKQMREAGIRGEIYPDCSKMKKQMGRADALSIPFVAIVGETEMAEGKLTLKNMATGEQQLLTPAEAITVIGKGNVR